AASLPRNLELEGLDTRNGHPPNPLRHLFGSNTTYRPLVDADQLIGQPQTSRGSRRSRMDIGDRNAASCPFPTLNLESFLVLEQESICGFPINRTPVCRRHKEWKRHIMETDQHGRRGPRLTAPHDTVVLSRASSQDAEWPQTYPGDKSSLFIQCPHIHLAYLFEGYGALCRG